MKLGVMNPVLASYSFEDALSYLHSLGVQCIEIGAGGYPGNAHLKPEELIGKPDKIKAYKDLLAKYEIEISAISCHGNPLHPNKELAESWHNQFKKAILVAEELGVDTVVGFSGCPGDCEESKNPNWVTCAWPNEYGDILKWQWEEKIIPYWKDMAEFAKAHSIKKIAFEMHPGFCVYNTETMLKIRKAVGPTIGANVDPSHLIWQGMDPVEVIRTLGKEKAIYNFHAKDTRIDKTVTAVNGVLDTKHYSDEINRSWVFRSLGYGTDEKLWKDMISMLQLVGYNHVLSIEHEDSIMTSKEGLEKAIAFLKNVMIHDPKPGTMFWA